MKCTSAIPAFIALGLASCDTMNQPISSGDFDPLRPPGSTVAPSTPQGPGFKAGQFVRTIMDNTTFFLKRPKGDVDADKLLTRGTSMKVISTTDTYVKVELDSGEVGFVPAIMVEDPNAVAGVPAGMNPGEYQVYPPVGNFSEPLPPLDPTGLPPDGAIPTVIDPEAPSTGNPIPPVTPLGDNFTAPEQPVTPPQPAPATEPAPLPPNDEDLKAAAEKPAAEEKPKEEAETPKLEE